MGWQFWGQKTKFKLHYKNFLNNITFFVIFIHSFVSSSLLVVVFDSAHNDPTGQSHVLVWFSIVGRCLSRSMSRTLSIVFRDNWILSWNFEIAIFWSYILWTPNNFSFFNLQFRIIFLFAIFWTYMHVNANNFFFLDFSISECYNFSNTIFFFNAFLQ